MRDRFLDFSYRCSLVRESMVRYLLAMSSESFLSSFSYEWIMSFVSFLKESFSICLSSSYLLI